MTTAVDLADIWDGGYFLLLVLIQLFFGFSVFNLDKLRGKRWWLTSVLYNALVYR